MSRLHEEPQQHIHGELCDEVNDFIINLKIHNMPLEDDSAEQQAKMMEARKRRVNPTMAEIVDLLQRCHREMIGCTKPYRKYHD